MLDKIEKYYPIILITPFIIIRVLIINNSSLTFFSDDAIYASFARLWSEHDFAHVFHPFWPPLYPFISSLLFPIVRDWEMTLRVISLISSVSLLIPIYFLSKHATSKFAATLICISIFLLTPIVHYSIFPMSDMLATSLIIASLTTLYFALLRNENKLFIYSALLLGLVYLTRSEGTMFFGLSFSYVVIYVVINVLSKKLPKEKLKIIPSFLFTFLLVIGPYVISTHNQIGFWTLSQKFNAQIQQGEAFKIKNGSTWAQEIWSFKPPDFNSKYWKGGQEFVLNNSYKLSKQFSEKTQKWKLVFVGNFPLWFVAITSIGFISFTRKNLWGDLFIIYIALIAVPATIFSTSFIDIRYLLWIIPILIIYFYKGVFKLLYKFPPILSSVIPFILITLTPIFSWESLNIAAHSEKFTKEHYRPQLVEVAKFISEN